MVQDYKLEKSDIVVLFSEIDHRYVDEGLFDSIVQLETDNFGSSFIRDRNPANPVFQLTLPQSKVIIQLVGTKLIITDSSNTPVEKSELIKKYFTSVYYPIINSVPCKPSAFGFNYVVLIDDPKNTIDKNMGINTLERNVGITTTSYNNTYSFEDSNKKYNLFVNKLGTQKRVQLNVHFDDIKPLSNHSDMQKMYVESWKYAEILFPKLKGTTHEPRTKK